MTLKMPVPRRDILSRRKEIVRALKSIVPGEGVIDTPEQMRAYETDGLTAYRQVPMVVALPETVAQVAAVLQYCSQHSIKVVPRGSGTSLSGGRCRLPMGCFWA
jgi:glycolate oxidase